MRNSHRGFIPLVAIILLGLVAVSGGVVATMALKGQEKAPAPPDQIDSLPPVAARVESSATTTTSTSPADAKPTVERIEAVTEKQVVLDTKSKEICDQMASVQIDVSKQSLAEDMKVLCELIDKGRYQEGEELDTALTRLHEKWELWLKVQKAEEPAKNRAQDIENGTR